MHMRSEIPGLPEPPLGGSTGHDHEVTRMMNEGCPIDAPADTVEQPRELTSLTPRAGRVPRGFRLSGPEAVDLSKFEDDGGPPPLEPAA